MGDVVDMPAAPAGPPSIAELVRCVDREIGFRVRVYPRHVERRKLAQATADFELARMRAVRDRLLLGEAWHTVLTGLAERAGVREQDLAVMVLEAEAAVRAIFPEPGP